MTESKGSVHVPLHLHEECELLMISNGPSAFLGDADNTLYLMDVPMLEARLQESTVAAN